MPKKDMCPDDLKLELFDEQAFEMRLASEPAIKVYRDTIEAAQKTLDERFMTNAPIRPLIYGRAWLIDQILAHAWDQSSLQQEPLMSLVAVGGYGRGELHPHSDIDLLVLHQGSALKKHQAELGSFLTFLWDIGLKVGHSVRTVKQCRDLAKDDITVATSVMESHTLAGSGELLEQLLKLTHPGKIWSPMKFFTAKREEQVLRYHKYNDTEYNLEPNVKGSPGGLRDIQMIGWVAKRHFGGSNLDDLVSNEFLNDSEFAQLSSGQDFLWKVRYGLHMLAGRPEDRLLFDYQRALAEIFGFKDTKSSLAIEKLMQEFYLVIMRILQLNEMLLQDFDEVIVRAKEKSISRQLNSRFKVTNDYIEVTDPQVFHRSRFALLEIFLLLAQNPEIQGVRAATIRLIRDSRNLIDDSFRSDIRSTSIFMELIRNPSGLSAQLQRMRRYGILGRYLPEFGKIIGQMQHDLFHIYTVDAHTLLLVKYLRRFCLQAETDRFPFISRVALQIPKTELLYIAGLYHDIAKGRGGDHSQLGRKDALDFCKRHHLGDWDANVVAWLVESHLTMSSIAQRRDISDPEIVQQFAQLVGDQLHLDYLYVLTVADINATNPKLWNSWRASLLRQLYVNTKRALSRGLDNPIDRAKAIAIKQQDALELLPFNPIVVTGLWQEFGEDYFIQHGSPDIVWHTRAILEHTDLSTPLVMVQDHSRQQTLGGSHIFIYTQTRHQQFAAAATMLEQLGLNIMAASINTSANDFNLTSYIVLEANGHPIGDNPQRIADIERALTKALQTPEQFSVATEHRTPRRLKHFNMPTEVLIYSDKTQPYTVLEVITPDRPGILARIGRLLLDHNIVLQKAKIATLGERVEDVFFITTEQSTPITDESLCRKLEAEICAVLDDTSQAKEPGQMKVLEL